MTELEIDDAFFTSVDYPGTIGDVDSSPFNFYVVGKKVHTSN